MTKRINKFFAALILFLLVFSTAASQAEATDYRESGSPDFLYYIEGTGAYYMPDSDADVFFSLGKWYRHSGTSWSVSAALGGPWGSLSISRVPKVLLELPPDFRSTHRFGRVPYRYVTGPESRDGTNYGRIYYSGLYYDDHGRRGYERRWHSGGQFWFFVAPDFDDDSFDDSHRGRRRRGRGGRGRY